VGRVALGLGTQRPTPTPRFGPGGMGDGHMRMGDMGDRAYGDGGHGQGVWRTGHMEDGARRV
jgi:hypothetical protein